MIRLLNISKDRRIDISLIKSKYRLYSLCKGSGLGCDVIIKTKTDTMLFCFDTVFKEHSIEFELTDHQQVEIIYVTKHLGSSLYKLDKLQTSSSIATIISHRCAFRYLQRAVSSINHQTLKPDLLVIVDDNCMLSSEIELIKNQYGDWIEIHTNKVSLGPFVNKNLALVDLIEHYDFINFIDSDDFVMHDTMNKMHKLLISCDDVRLVNTFMTRIKEDRLLTESSSNPLSRIAKICQSGFMCKSNVFDDIGFFDSCRYGADSEYYHRAYKMLGSSSIAFIFENLYYAELRDNSLTTSYYTRSLHNSNTIEGICYERLEYSKSFNEHTIKSIPISIKKYLPDSINVFKSVKIRTLCFCTPNDDHIDYIDQFKASGIDVKFSVIGKSRTRKKMLYKKKYGLSIYITSFIKPLGSKGIATCLKSSLTNNMWSIKKVDKNICRWYYSKK